MEEHIVSRQNRLFTHLRKLQTSHAYRLQTREFCGDGTKLLEEASRWYAGLHTVVAAEGLVLPPLGEQVRVVRVPEWLMEAVSSMRTPQGAVFLCHMPPEEPLALRPGTLILDGIQDPGNLGTILRTADALNVPVVLTDGCADPYNEKTVRASMGAVFRAQPSFADANALIAQCRTQGIPIAATAMSAAASDLRQVPLADYALVIGSEGQGVRASLLEAARVHVVIPMNERCESLNAAVAAAIVMWQMKR